VQLFEFIKNLSVLNLSKNRINEPSDPRLWLFQKNLKEWTIFVKESTMT
jgi:hypothetical protein